MSDPTEAEAVREQLNQLHSTVLKDWLKLVGDGESPDLFNIWSWMSGVAACAGQKVYMDLGRFRYVPNMYIVLCGPAAVRKSSAAGIIKKILLSYTDVKFGPDDTGGRRQGLITAFNEAYAPPTVEDEIDDALLAVDVSTPNTVEDDILAQMREKDEARGSSFTDIKNTPKDLYIFADEFSAFVGIKQHELITCLTALYYPQNEYSYQLAKSKTTVYKPGLNLLACATPTSINTSLPETAIGQGLSSRTIFVYVGRAKPKVFPAPVLNEKLLGKFTLILHHISTMDNVELIIEQPALDRLSFIYKNYVPDIDDARFEHYIQRRLDHLVKLTMAIALGEGREVVNINDVNDAQLVLALTEEDMPNALGQLGLAKDAVAKQRLKEMIENSWPNGIAMHTVKANMARDMPMKDIEPAVDQLAQAGHCKVTTAISENRDLNGREIEYKLIMPKPRAPSKRKGRSRPAKLKADTLGATLTEEGVKVPPNDNIH